MLIKDQLYALQLLEYEPNRFLRWLARNPFRFHLERKKKLVYTSKARFLIVTATLIPALLLLMNATLLYLKLLTAELFLMKASLVATVYFLFPGIYLVIALLILKTYEIPNRQRTIRQAQRILARHHNLIVIGITGSFGKTSVKEVLAQLLAKKYKVLATPKSFNTLFGIAQVIENDLKPDCEIFIVEMGAYRRGEIAEICQMVKPNIGILTGITNQHLERFGSLANIAQAKYELAESLSASGLSVFNLDSSECLRLYEKTKVPKIGYSIKTDQADLSAQPLIADHRLVGFSVRNGDKFLLSKLDTEFGINLPGEHNISNSLAALSVALFLKVDLADIRDSLLSLSQPQHRLQFIDATQGSLVIDDSYSSNPEGAQAALKMVKQLPHQPKIVVTPGMVELGVKQYEENKKFGKLIAENFDYAIIVNKTNRRALLDGLLAGGWLFLKHTLAEHLGFSAKQLENYNIPEEIDNRVFVADSLDQATREIIPQLIRPGSLVLFENDLPDIYE